MKNSIFQLKGRPSLEKIKFEKNNDFYFPEDLDLKIESSTNIYKSEDNEAKVLLELRIFDFDNIQNYPFAINVSISGNFVWKDTDEASLDLLLHVNAPALLYSYIRPLVTTLTVEADVPPLVLPMMNFKK